MSTQSSTPDAEKERVSTLKNYEKKIKELEKENQNLKEIIHYNNREKVLNIDKKTGDLHSPNTYKLYQLTHFIINGDGMVQTWDSRLTDMTGISTNDIIGQKITSFIDVTLNPNEKQFSFEWFINNKNLKIQFNYFQYLLKQNDFYICYIHDFTMMEQVVHGLMNSINQYRFLFEKTNEGIALFEALYDRAGVLKNYICYDVNPEYEKGFNITRKQMLGKLLSDMNIFDNREIIKILQAMDQDPYICFFEEWREYKGKKWSIAIYVPRKGELAIIFRDLTAYMRTEELHFREKIFRDLRMNMWKLAADHSIRDEEQLIEKLFEMVGGCLNTSRITYNSFNHRGETVVKFEWINDGVSPSEGSNRIPQSIWSLYFDQPYVIFHKEEFMEKIKVGQPLYEFRDTVLRILEAEKITSVVFFPFYINGIPEGILTFDWCKDQPKFWTDGEIHTGIDLKQIIAMSIYKFRVERALKLSEKRYRDVVEDQTDLICRIRPTGKIIFVNSAFIRFFNFHADEIYGQNLYHILDSSVKYKFVEVINILNYNHRIENVVIEFQIDRHTYWIQWTLQGIFDTIGTILEIQIVGRNITDLRITENQLKTSLREKEILLREVNHRVKNNLQIVSSLLKLQTFYIQDIKIKEQLTITLNRIQTISLLHQMLYSADNIGTVNMSDFIPELAVQIVNVFSENFRRIKLHTEIDDVYLNPDAVINIGLIINELITNSVKHAFNRDLNLEEKIYIYLKKDNRKIKLIIGDNGKGFPEGFDPDHTDSLGLELVKGLINNLSGTYTIKNIPGVQFSIYFDLSDDLVCK